MTLPNLPVSQYAYDSYLTYLTHQQAAVAPTYFPPTHL